MRTLVVGAGALGGLIAVRLQSAGHPVALATRDERTAQQLRADGLRAFGRGGEATINTPDALPLSAFLGGREFDLVILATKAADAIAIAPDLETVLHEGGTLLPLQNGGVALEIAELQGGGVTMGGISNLGATMHAPGVYEQRNDGHILIGEIAGGSSARMERIRDWLSPGVDTRLAPDLTACIWSKLLINCSVTTLGAIAGGPMRSFVDDDLCLRLFFAVYREALAIAHAAGVQPARMIVEPVPPGPRDDEGERNWLAAVLDAYGDIKPSMLQDLERGRQTEIRFINGHVVRAAERLQRIAPLNSAVMSVVESMTQRCESPALDRLRTLAAQVVDESASLSTATHDQGGSSTSHDM